MTIAMNPFLKNTLQLDAAMTGAAAILMAAGAGLIGPLLDISTTLLLWSGLVLLPFVGLLVILSRRDRVSRMLVLDVVLINAAWVIASFGIMLFGWVEPNLLGALFISAQALAVAFFATLQAAALKSAGAAAA